MRLLSTFTGMPSRTRKRKKSPLGIGLLKGPGERDLHGIAVADGRTVGAGHRGLPQNHLHMLDMGAHLGRYIKGARVGKGGGIGPGAQDLIIPRQHRIFQCYRDQLSSRLSANRTLVVKSACISWRLMCSFIK